MIRVLRKSLFELRFECCYGHGNFLPELLIHEWKSLRDNSADKCEALSDHRQKFHQPLTINLVALGRDQQLDGGLDLSVLQIASGRVEVLKRRGQLLLFVFPNPNRCLQTLVCHFVVVPVKHAACRR